MTSKKSQKQVNKYLKKKWKALWHELMYVLHNLIKW